jgi:hypothetical protein
MTVAISLSILGWTIGLWKSCVPIPLNVGGLPGEASTVDRMWLCVDLGLRLRLLNVYTEFANFSILGPRSGLKAGMQAQI